ncbi:MAG: radical SAM protein, partial [Bacteroidales bacterium]
PNLLTDEIIHLVAAEPRLMPHFHIPLQSGSDTVLKAMGRRYDTGIFASRIQKIRQLMPHACIAVDLIVGFPAETDALFQESMEFIRSQAVSYVHVFTYSERDNTRATTLNTTVAPKQRHQRSQLMHRLSEEKMHAFYQDNLANTSQVLWEKENINGFMTGFTENYLKVKTPYNHDLCNTIQPVQLNNLSSEGIYLV